jgi:hypothetical protein
MPYFSVSLTKLSVMSVLTWGLYPLFWHFKNWQLVSVRTGGGRYLQPLAQTLLAFFLCYPLFKRISHQAHELGIRQFGALPLAAAWILLTLAERLPDWSSLVSLTSFVPLLRVQIAVNEINAIAEPERALNARFSVWNLLACAMGSVIHLFVVLEIFAPELLELADPGD